MTPSEAAVFLAAVTSGEGSEVTESRAKLFAAALPDVTLQDALEFLPTYYRNATHDGRNWIYPGDVLEGVKDLHDARRGAASRAAYQAVMATGNPNDDDTLELRAARAAVAAREEYDRTHTVPGKTDVEQHKALVAKAELWSADPAAADRVMYG